MTYKAVTDTGDIDTCDPYYYAGSPLPDYVRYLDDLSRDELLALLPAILDRLDDRIRALES